MLRNRSCEALEHFSWKDLLVALKKETPITLSLLKQCVHVKRQVHNPHGKGRSSSRTPNEETAVGVCFAILMRTRSQGLNLMRLMSILLCGSHAPNQVSHY